MTTYRGPNASVKQEFEISPAAIAIENLPPVAVATAYDVYAKEQLSLAIGIDDITIPWPTAEQVVYARSVAGYRAFEFYPPRVFANSSFGYQELFDSEHGDTDIVFEDDGVIVAKDAAYTIPNTEKIAGSCNAIIPFYYKATGTIQILAADLRTVIIQGGSVATAQLKAGQTVSIYNGGWTVVGVVGVIGTDETRIRLASAYSVPILNGTRVVVGNANNGTDLQRPNVLYDADADFISARVRPGDLLKFSSLALSGTVTTPVVASIVSVIDKNTIKFNTTALTAGLETYEGYKYSNKEPGNTVSVYSYKIERLCGFSQNYDMQSVGTGVVLENVQASKAQFDIPAAVGGDVVPAMKVGDIIMLSSANTVPATYPRPYAIKSIVYHEKLAVGTTTTTSTPPPPEYVYTVTTNEAMLISATAGATSISNGNYLSAWSPKVQHDIVSDFRAIRTAENLVVKRITSKKDITDAWSKDSTISIYNELAYMALIELSLGGGRVCYGINVDSSAADLAGEYTEALEKLKLLDVYSHAIGSTDGGVNALMGPYCDEQADPYEGHERKAILSYDQRDLYLLGSDSAATCDSNGLVTAAGVNLMNIGLTTKDQVEVYSSTGKLIDTLTVTSTPAVTNQVQTNGITAYGASAMRFVCARPAAQALLVGALDLGNRRLKVVFPGWFYAQANGVRTIVPPYYIAAAIAGNDCAMQVSQSFTNMDFAIPGLASYELGTNFTFRKGDLDEIGGGGVDIMIQDAQISQTIKSRHDLTTNMDAVEYRENSITKQVDVAAKTLRSAVAPYVGRYNIGTSLFRFLNQICSVVCTKITKDGILSKMEVTSIERDPVIADKINFIVTATVFVAGNDYDITLYVKSR